MYICDMLQGLLHAHSGLRWLVLGALILAVIFAFIGRREKKVALITMILAHVQLLIGLILYFISPRVEFSGAAMKDSMLRFFLVEHSLLMIVSILLITIGYAKFKQSKYNAHKWLYAIALLLILVSIPWPFRGFGTGWF